MAFKALATVIRLIDRIRAPIADLSNCLPGCCAVLTSTSEVLRARCLPRDITCGLPKLSITGVCSRVSCVRVRDIAFNCNERGMVRSNSIQVGGNSFAIVSKVSNVKGDAFFGLLAKILAPRGNDVDIISNNGGCRVSGCVHPLFTCIPRKGVLVDNAVHSGVGLAGDATASSRILRTTGVDYTCSFVGRLPDNLSAILVRGNEKLSRKRVRHLTITETILSNTPIVLLSRTASTLSTRARGGLLLNLESLGNEAYIVVSRGATTFRITSDIVRVGSKRLRSGGVWVCFFCYDVKAGLMWCGWLFYIGWTWGRLGE